VLLHNLESIKTSSKHEKGGFQGSFESRVVQYHFESRQGTDRASNIDAASGITHGKPFCDGTNGITGTLA
jgi:CDGSH-type Zn-finger protein